jgi:hypothetical protein
MNRKIDTDPKEKVMSDDRILTSMRGILWEEAKGKLRALLNTYYPDQNGTDYFEPMDKAVNKFIKNVEDNGWAI